MKIKLTLLFTCISVSFFAQTLNKVVLDTKQKPMLLGKTNKEAFTNKEFSWFEKNYNEYVVNTPLLNKLNLRDKKYTVKAFYGSWCGDSKRELPKFYKVIDELKIDENNLEVYAVNKGKENYKTAPNGEEKGLNIHRVPTFIFYENNLEIGRIVEYPKQDFERDIFKIINRKKYLPNYAVVHYLHNMLTNKTVNELTLQEKELTTYLSEYTKGSRELNTYGYKLLRSNQQEKALFVFKLNTKMYPYKWNVFDSYAEALFETKNYTEALKFYKKAMELNTKQEEEIKKKIQEINNKLK